MTEYSQATGWKKPPHKVIFAFSGKVIKSSKTSRKRRVKLLNLISQIALILLVEGMNKETEAPQSKIYYCFPWKQKENEYWLMGIWVYNLILCLSLEKQPTDKRSVDPT